MEEEESVRKFEIKQEEINSLEYISTENDFAEINEKNFQSCRNRIRSTHEKTNHKDQELLEVLFQDVESVKVSQRANLVKSERVYYTKKKTNQQKENPLFFSENLNYQQFSKSSQRNLIERMEQFLQKKKEFVANEIKKEKDSHHPLITFKGYMSKAKTVAELSVGQIQKKNNYLSKVKAELEFNQIKEIRDKPEININNNAKSKLGLNLSHQEYISNINMQKQIEIHKKDHLKRKQIEDELKECSHKPIIKVLDKKILQKTLVDKKSIPRNYSSRFIKKNHKANKENIFVQKESLNSVNIEKQTLEIKNCLSKPQTKFEEDIQNIKRELKILLLKNN